MDIRVQEVLDGYELRVTENGKVKVWVFPNAQALMSKLAQFLYDDRPAPKRSLLLGEYEEKKEEPTPRERMDKIVDEVKKKLQKEGLIPVEEKPEPQPIYPNTQPFLPYVGTPDPDQYPTITVCDTDGFPGWDSNTAGGQPTQFQPYGGGTAAWQSNINQFGYSGSWKCMTMNNLGFIQNKP